MSIKKPTTWEYWEFENNKLRKSLPTDLIKQITESAEEDKYGGYLLTLAVIFNDLKGLILLHDTIIEVYKAPTSITEISEHRGELEGLKIQLLTLLLSSLYEVFEFLEKSRDIYSTERIQKIIKETSSDTQIVWEMLNRIACNDAIEDDKFKSFLELKDLLFRIRNNIGFHYQTRKSLLGGYRKFFFGDLKITKEARAWAYKSMMGTAVMESRYFYADAALQGYYMDIFKDEKLAQERVDEAFRLLNYISYTINDILIKYHASLPSR